MKGNREAALGANAGGFTARRQLQAIEVDDTTKTITIIDNNG